MSGTEILIGNFALALLAAILLWRAALHREDLMRLSHKHRRLQLTDELTDLPNRAHLQAQLTQAIQQPGPEPALLMIDLDGFKDINDSLGHSAGDDLLKAVAERFKSCVGKDDTLARLGGDEFAALIVCPQSCEAATAAAQSVRSVLSDPFVINTQPVTVTASIGIAALTDRTVDAAEALRRADVAMYVAKGSRHSSFAIYSPDMDETLKIRRTISAELDAALSRGELQLVYQPLVCARTGKLVSAEALMRWPGKSGQAGSPGIFIPIAEETGLITRLGDWALDEAVSEIKRQKNLPIAVNVSPVQFRGDKFAESVSAAIARHGVDASLLRVEITEGVLISHTEEAYRTMRQLREMGVQVLLDDFGTGYSSLSYLHKFEFDGLKIDRAFLQQLNDPRTGINLLKSIIALGHSLNMKVIAEGVETEEQAAILQLLACDQLQGYALGRPDRPEKLAGTPTASVLQRAAAHRAN